MVNIIKFRRIVDIFTCILLGIFLLILPIYIVLTVKLHNAIITNVNNINVRFK